VRAARREEWVVILGVRTARLGLVVVLGLTAGLLSQLASRQFVGYDSYWHVFIARQEHWWSFWQEVLANAHPPLYYLALKVGIWLLGPSHFAYRAISIAAVLVGSVCLALIVERVTRSALAGLIAAAGFGLSYNSAVNALEVRAYTLSVALLLVAFWAYLDWVRTPPHRFPGWKRGVFAGMLVAALLTHYASFFFLAAALGTPVLLWLIDARWRRRLVAESRQHLTGLVVMFGVPLTVALAAYAAHAALWAHGLTHVADFMFDPARETVVEFLIRTTQALAVLFLPTSLGPGPWSLAAVGAVVGVISWLTLRRRGRTRARVVPLAFLGLMAALNMVAAVAHRYPYGGEARQEYFLFPFAVMSLVLAAERVRTMLPAGLARSGWSGILGLILAWSVWSWTTAFPWTPNYPMRNQLDTLRSSFGVPGAVLVDQFNFINLYADYHDWNWSLDRQEAHRSAWQIWRVSKGPTGFRVCRDGRWQLDLSQGDTYFALADCLEMSGADQVVVFRPQQAEFRATWNVADTVTLARAFAPRVGLHPEVVRVEGEDVYAAFRSANGRLLSPRPITVLEATYGASCRVPGGNLSAAVRAACDGRSSCAYRVDVGTVSDPAPGCAKDFGVVWSCGDGESRQLSVAAEAGFGGIAFLDCAQRTRSASQADLLTP
jgi:hypothetical protein